ncbi:MULTISPECIES: DUF885 family protein [Asticcacaulis]|uniref:DUF885 domain-containing protein n=1 Tax=Asticcacaulis TaxID=76890 RepID=UPI001AE7DEF3|nr:MULTISPECIES: DUF885 family protein [Asticcacaulis]MBP2159332.1 uncharacterized protein (DUF885 family) [Asticcacaulis solisilvae]MDR6800377.1 uncharacterized protein (DUF885 family) [Asticcacaulis sp. BE141]
MTRAVRVSVLLGLVCSVSILPVMASAQTVPVSPPAVQAGVSADANLKALYEAEWAWRQAEFGRSIPGRGADGPTLPSVTPETYARRLAYWDKALKMLDQIPVDQLSHDERINAEVFRASLTTQANNIRFKTYEAPFNSDSFFWTFNPRTPYRTAEEYRNYLGRLRDIRRYFAEQTVNMKAGLKRGYTVPYVSTVGRDKTMEPYTKADETNPFYDAFAQMPETIPADEAAALKAEARTVIRDVVAPEYTRLLTFFRTEYQPRARRDFAAWSLPNGKAFYKARIQEFVTLDMTPEEIHQLGLKEVTRIRADMEKTMRDSGFKGTFAEFLVFMRTDPQFYAKTPRELLSYSAYVSKKADGKLKDFFAVLPRYRHAILPVPDAVAPIYTSGRGGLDSCLMNTYALESRPLYNLPALTLHECTPGHSYQAAAALEAPPRPEFRRYTGFSGYGEGWGLYTEWLGTKMGIYETPYEEFGRQTFEMWRAARLAIDTGLHTQGWTRQQAIDYLKDNTALAQLDIENEVDRYIAWPGQALAYKIGELKMREMRSLAEKELGADFDQRTFHDTILNMGSVPLTTFEREMRGYVDAEKTRVAKKVTPNAGN